MREVLLHISEYATLQELQPQRSAEAYTGLWPAGDKTFTTVLLPRGG
jgi:hypothetical protein